MRRDPWKALLTMAAALLALGLAAWPTQAGEPRPEAVVVRTGETLREIAARYRLLPHVLIEANGLTGRALYPGMRLMIPEAETDVDGFAADCRQTALYTVRRGDTLPALAKAWGTTVAELKAANGLVGEAIWVGQGLRRPCSPSADGADGSSARTSRPRCGAEYVVRRGDTLAGIAEGCGVTLSALKQLNHLKGDTVLVGQNLRIPLPTARDH
ncbi:MAG: LysM peptidoglycan-binding domain-containing protein [Caldilineales bacterium]|nr:LysM peptidoglycan-binding domain-containing protein [Caldilineales bacterium]MDW8316657.1 LysM peptidoglycan-binding domain-containing protein [Anaerolineae bacterium]